MEQAECSETSAYKIRRRGITQKKTYNIQNTAKVWNQECMYLFFSLPTEGFDWCYIAGVAN